MANPATLYRFKISLSDIDRALYEDLDIRAAMHPSEIEPYLLTRVLAYVLNYEEGLIFSAGLASADEPALQLPEPGGNGRIAKWIDIGTPSMRRIHKASKMCRSVCIYTYKDPQLLRREAAKEKVHRANEIKLFAFQEAFLLSLAKVLKRDNQWAVIHTEGELVITVGEETFIGTLTALTLGD